MGDALRSGTATPDDVEGAFARFVSLDIDPQKHRNALHIPADAGPHAAAIETILRHIPDGWGRWISVEAGWCPLVIATDQRLAELDAEYVVRQVKEKFGTLRYYCAPGGEDPSPELLDTFDAITDDAERASAMTCERCGEPGVLQRTRYWAETLCHACAEPSDTYRCRRRTWGSSTSAHRPIGAAQPRCRAAGPWMTVPVVGADGYGSPPSAGANGKAVQGERRLGGSPSVVVGILFRRGGRLLVRGVRDRHHEAMATGGPWPSSVRCRPWPIKHTGQMPRTG